MSNIVWQDRKRTLFGLPLSFTKYELYEDRLVIRKGIFRITEDEVRLYRIMDVSLERSLYQRIFGIGTINCCSADKTLGDFSILSVKKSKDVKLMLSDMVEAERDAKRVVTREFMAGDDTGADSFM